jgi:alanyl-tRNA synthetase
MELCGGTHLDRTGQIGYFRITGEEGIAAGVRRIEAVTGETADQSIREEKGTLKRIENLLRCREDEIENRIEKLIEERKMLEKKAREAQKSSAAGDLDAMLNRAVQMDGIQVVVSKIEAGSVEELRNLGDHLRSRLKSGVGVLGAEMDGKVQLLCVVSDDLIRSRNLNAGTIVKKVAQIVDGSGGGKPHLALAGGKEIGKLNEALKRTPEIIKELIG